MLIDCETLMSQSPDFNHINLKWCHLRMSRTLQACRFPHISSVPLPNPLHLLSPVPYWCMQKEDEKFMTHKTWEQTMCLGSNHIFFFFLPGANVLFKRRNTQNVNQLTILFFLLKLFVRSMLIGRRRRRASFSRGGGLSRWIFSFLGK